MDKLIRANFPQTPLQMHSSRHKIDAKKKEIHFLTIAARLFKRSALSTKPNAGGGTTGFTGGWVTPLGGTARAIIDNARRGMTRAPVEVTVLRLKEGSLRIRASLGELGG